MPTPEQLRDEARGRSIFREMYANWERRCQEAKAIREFEAADPWKADPSRQDIKADLARALRGDWQSYTMADTIDAYRRLTREADARRACPPVLVALDPSAEQSADEWMDDFQNGRAMVLPTRLEVVRQPPSCGSPFLDFLADNDEAKSIREAMQK